MSDLLSTLYCHGDISEPLYYKTNKMSVRPAKTQISLGIHPVWSWSSLCTQWVAKDPWFLHADSENSDQTGCTLTLMVLSCRSSFLHGNICLKKKCQDINSSCSEWINLTEKIWHWGDTVKVWGLTLTLLSKLYRLSAPGSIFFGKLVRNGCYTINLYFQNILCANIVMLYRNDPKLSDK